MIEVNNEELKLKRNEAIKCKIKCKNANSSNTKEYEDKLEEEYIKWLLDFKCNLDKELNVFFKKEYISIEEANVSPILKRLILETKKNMKTNRVKSKLTSCNVNNINLLFSKLDDIKWHSCKHNEDLYIIQTKKLIKERKKTNDIKLLTELLSIYENYIKPYKNEIKYSRTYDFYNDLLYLKDLLEKYKSIEELVKDYENSIIAINEILNNEKLILEEDKNRIKADISNLKYYADNYYRLLKQVFNKQEFNILSNFKNYILNLDYHINKHNNNIIRLKRDLLARKIKQIVYKDKEQLLIELNEYKYSSLKNINEITKSEISEELYSKIVELIKESELNEDTIELVKQNLKEFYNILINKLKQKNLEYIRLEKKIFLFIQ